MLKDAFIFFKAAKGKSTRRVNTNGRPENLDVRAATVTACPV
jgi:hypothetical protein